MESVSADTGTDSTPKWDQWSQSGSVAVGSIESVRISYSGINGVSQGQLEWGQ